MLFETLYNLLWDMLFSEVSMVPVNWVELCCALLTTVGTLFMVAIPFLVVWRVITLIVRAW